MNISLDTRLSIKTQRKKIYVVDGIVSYPIGIINNTESQNIVCLCNMNKILQENNLNQFCKHIHCYMHHRGLDLDMLSYWTKMRKHIVNALQGSGKVNNTELWGLVHREILDGECGFCLGLIIPQNRQNDKEWINNVHVCSKCQGVIHETCFRKWNKKKSGCMLCRAVSDQ